MSTTTVYDTVGALEIGAWLSTFLCGCLTFQTYSYFTQRSSADTWRLKLWIAFLWASEVVHTVSSCGTIWNMTTADFGHPDELFKTHTMSGLYVSTLIQNVISPSVQAYYAWRIHLFSDTLSITIVCFGLILARAVGVVSLIVIAFRSDNSQDFEAKVPWLFVATMALSAATDIITAASMCFYLRRGRQNVFCGTAALLDRIMYWTVQTGMLTSVVTTSALLCFVIMPVTFVWLTPQFIIAKLYSNALLATLNGREALRQMNQDAHLVVTIDTIVESSEDGIRSPPRIQPLQMSDDAIELKNSPLRNKDGWDGFLPLSRTMSHSSTASLV
ncbi:hypothetical protein PLICRDRAFT_325665 [Plicaturopsis crispa FD-325 SS-3]|nr:hypothetical protein PLICRDRAFT_325665 [Plicaturopsis crispa FD-325 SS-3]